MSRWFTAGELDADGAVVGYARRCVCAADPQLWADDLDHVASYDRTSAVSALQMPVTLIAAELDHVGTVNAMTALADQLAHADVHVLPGAGHMSPFVHPPLLADLLRIAAARA